MTTHHYFISNRVRTGLMAAMLAGLAACAGAPADGAAEAPAETTAAAPAADGVTKVPMLTWDQKKSELRSMLAESKVTLGDTPEGMLKIGIPSDGLFALGKSTVSPAFAKVLDTVAEALNSYPETSVEVVGHTDSTGSDALNLAISAKRAESTRDYLVGRQVATDRITTQGWGSDQPVADNKTYQGRAANRRVEIFVSGR